MSASSGYRTNDPEKENRSAQQSKPRGNAADSAEALLRFESRLDSFDLAPTSTAFWSWTRPVIPLQLGLVDACVDVLSFVSVLSGPEESCTPVVPPFRRGSASSFKFTAAVPKA